MVRLRSLEDGRAVGEETLSGKIKGITKTEILFVEEGKERSIPANIIVWTQIDREPINLTTARTLMQSAQYAEAIAKIGELTPGEQKNLAPFALQDSEYITAVSTAMLALARQNSQEYANAGKMLTAFLKKNPESYHVAEVTWLIGNLLVAMKKPGNARTFFDRLAQMPWPDVRLKAMIASGDLSLEEGNLEESQKNYNAVLSFSAEDSSLIQEQKFNAKIGLARINIRQKKYDEAVKSLREIIATQTLSSPELLARLYNTLGQALADQGDVKAAILAYLHTDLLYSNARVEHVTALRQLYRLWKRDSHEDRAAEVLRVLQDEYKITAP